MLNAPCPLRLSLRAFCFLACLVLVAGCGTAGKDGGGGNSNDKAASADTKGGAGGVGEAEGPKDEGKTTKAVRFDPEEYIGYAPERLLPLLGAPDFVRRDGTAQVWQYRAEHCVLDLFLYGNGNDSRVKHVELRKRMPTAEPVEKCFSRMREKRQPKPTG